MSLHPAMESFANRLDRGTGDSVAALFAVGFMLDERLQELVGHLENIDARLDAIAEATLRLGAHRQAACIGTATVTPVS